MPDTGSRAWTEAEDRRSPAPAGSGSSPFDLGRCCPCRPATTRGPSGRLPAWRTALQLRFSFISGTVHLRRVPCPPWATTC